MVGNKGKLGKRMPYIQTAEKIHIAKDMILVKRISA